MYENFLVAIIQFNNELLSIGRETTFEVFSR